MSYARVEESCGCVWLPHKIPMRDDDDFAWAPCERHAKPGQRPPFLGSLLPAEPAAKCATCEDYKFICDMYSPPRKCASKMFCQAENNRRPCPSCGGGS